MSTTTLRLQHSSLEVFDPHPQQRRDAVKVFSLDRHIITGTEAGPGKGSALRAALAREALRNGYLFYCPAPQDSWVAIKRDLILPDTKIEKGCPIILRGAKALGDPHPYGPKGLPWVTVQTELGEVTVGAGHWLTKGRRPGQAQDDHPGDPVNHYRANTIMGEAVGDWAKRKGAGKALVFYGADTNLDDKAADVFRGEPLTTCWDEVEKWPNTGHGPIDVIATYDRDGRVHCRSAEVLDDSEFFLFGDHYTVVADYRVQNLPATPPT